MAFQKLEYADELAGMGSVVVTETIARKDAGDEPTGMYSRRVSVTTTEHMAHTDTETLEKTELVLISRDWNQDIYSLAATQHECQYTGAHIIWTCGNFRPSLMSIKRFISQ